MINPPPAIILAGGFGTRLREVVKNVPKPLAPVRGVPFLRYILAYLESEGVTQVVVSTGYLGELVAAEVEGRFGRMNVVCVQESEPLGTGGAVRFAMDRAGIDDGLALALNGDTYFPIPLQPLLSAFSARSPEPSAAMALRHVADASRYGTVRLDTDGTIRAFQEKGVAQAGAINGGIYLLGKNFRDAHPPGARFSIESDFLTPAAGKGTLIGLTHNVPFIDIGIPSDYGKAEFVLPSRI